jgi:uncharacterized protein YdiU (UPF0061 family)
MNQPVAAQKNFLMFTQSLRPMLASSPEHLAQLNQVEESFPAVMQEKMNQMWAKKLGLKKFDPELFSELERLMSQTPVDYTIFFRSLSNIPETIKELEKSFYRPAEAELSVRWTQWLSLWRARLEGPHDQVSKQMKTVNPKYTLREWFLVPAYQKAAEGDYTLLRELNQVMTRPYDDQENEKYDRLKPLELFRVAGVSHVSCSS